MQCHISLDHSDLRINNEDLIYVGSKEGGNGIKLYINDD